MKSRPIIFKAPQVRAILDGQKTQMRRPVKPTGSGLLTCPYGEPGDRLWVRETWIDRCNDPDVANIEYRADYNAATMPDWKWRPSIFMPKDYSRISLEITGIRVQRLFDISEADALAEGFYEIVPFPQGGSYYLTDPEGTPQLMDGWTAHEAFVLLWTSIYGSGSWSHNPWVWALTFNCIEPDISAP